MLIKGEVASLNHRDSTFLRPNLDSSLNLGVDRGVLTQLLKIVPFLNFVNVGDGDAARTDGGVVVDSSGVGADGFESLHVDEALVT